MNLNEFLTSAIEQLRQAGVDNPALDARLLAGHALGFSRAQILSQSGRELSPDEISAIKVFLAKRAVGEPVSRLIGRREFWGLTFGLNEATLDPRADTETLIEAVLKNAGKRDTILDLGTGTGCLLLSLVHEIPYATGLGVDIAPRAVEQARRNADDLELSDRAVFRVRNWLQGIDDTFDIIVSNPPYIASSDIPKLMKEVREYDPLLALDGGDDGLAVYRLLIPQLSRVLNPEGFVAFEVGQGQASQVAQLFEENCFLKIAVHKDLGGIERCVTASYP